MQPKVCLCFCEKGGVFVSNCFVDLRAVKPKQRRVHFTEHEKILHTTLESYINRVRVVIMLATKTRQLSVECIPVPLHLKLAQCC